MNYLLNTKNLLLLISLTIFESVPAQGIWTQKADYAGTARSGSTGFSIGEMGYIVTGSDGLNSYPVDFWEFNSLTNSWSQKADFPGPGRTWAVAFSIGTKGFVGSGYKPYATMSDFWAYEQTSNSWNSISSPSYLTSAAAFAIGTKGYLGTGSSTGNSVLKIFKEYNSIYDSWSQKANFGGSARIYATGFSIGAKGFIGFGGDSTGVRNDLWEFSPSSNSWSQKADCPCAGRESAVSFVIDSFAFIGTGYDGTSYRNDLWKYDNSTNAWSQAMDFPGTGRYISVGFSIGKRGYIGTGNGGSGNHFNDFWEYDPYSTGLDDKYYDKLISIYPNPVFNGEVITVNGSNELIVYDAKGQSIKHAKGSQNKISFNSDFFPGMYYFCFFKNGLPVFTRKIIIAK